MKQIRIVFPLVIALVAAIFITSCRDEFTEQDALALQEQLDKDRANFQDSLRRVREQDSINNILRLDSARYARERDSLARVGGIINYSVTVAYGNTGSFTKDGMSRIEAIEDVAGSVVTVQQNGQVHSITVDASGVAVFPDLRIGRVSGSINKPGFTTVSFEADITPSNMPNIRIDEKDGTVTINITVNGGTNTVQVPANASLFDYFPRSSASSIVPIFELPTGTPGPKFASISGYMTIESNLTNTSREVVPSGTTIAASMNVNDESFKNYFNYVAREGDDNSPISNDDPRDGALTKLAFSNSTFVGTADAEGFYSILVPAMATEEGMPYVVKPADITIPQLLFIGVDNNGGGTANSWERKSVLTTFGPDNGNYSVVNQVPANFLTVVEIEAPEGFAPASAVAVIDRLTGSIDTVIVNDGGQGYTQAPIVVFDLPTGATGIQQIQAKGTAAITNGRVTSVTITEAGQGYDATNPPGVTFRESITVPAQLGFLLEDDGSIESVFVNDPGRGYTQAPRVVFSPAPSGDQARTAVATANIDAAGRVTSVTIVDAGRGYAVGTTVSVEEGVQANATAVAIGTEQPGTIVSIGINNSGSNYQAPPVLTISSTDGSGTGAAAQAVLNADGEVIGVNVTNPGTGYRGNTVFVEAQPTFSREADVRGTFTAGVAEIGIGASGSGYASAPAVTISGGGGTGATATAIMSGTPINDVTITNNGSGYRQAPTVTVVDDTGSGANITANLQNGPVESVEFVVNTNTFYAFNQGPSVNFTGAATGVAALAATGSVLSFNINNGGLYASVPTIAVAGGTGGIFQAEIFFDNVGALAIVGGGTDYQVGDAVTINYPGASAVIEVLTVSGTGAIQTFNITNRGSNFATLLNSESTSVSGGNGNDDATFRVTSLVGGINNIDVIQRGSGYANNAIVTVSGGGVIVGSEADVTSNIGFNLGSVTITNGGSYANPPTVTFPGGTVLAGGGATTSVQAVLAPRGVQSLTINNSGNEYSNPTIQFSAPQVGTNAATATATTNGLQVAAIEVTAAGTGYTSFPTVTVAPAPLGGTNATAFVDELTRSSLSSIRIVDAGADYTVAPRVEVDEFGVGVFSSAGLTATLVDGRVDAVAIDNAGSYDSNDLLGEVSLDVLSGAGFAAGNIVVDDRFILTGIQVTESGLGYTSAPLVIIEPTTPIAGDPEFSQGTDATATAVVTDGKVTSITLDNAGSGYSALPNVTIKTFVDAATLGGTVSDQGGAIREITVLDGGFGFTAVPIIDIQSDNGVGARAEAVIENGSIVRVNLIDGGRDYDAGTTSVEAITFIREAIATARVERGGSITGVVVTEQGENLSAQTTVSFSDPVDGVRATGTPVIVDGKLVSIIVTNPGYGYTAVPTITINDPNAPTQAEAIAVIEDGVITSIRVTNRGRGYQTAPRVRINGYGTGAEAEVSSLVEGRVVAIEVTEGGSDYSTGNTPNATENFSSKGAPNIAADADGRFKGNVRGGTNNAFNVHYGTGERLED